MGHGRRSAQASTGKTARYKLYKQRKPFEFNPGRATIFSSTPDLPLDTLVARIHGRGSDKSRRRQSRESERTLGFKRGFVQILGSWDDPQFRGLVEASPRLSHRSLRPADFAVMEQQIRIERLRELPSMSEVLHEDRSDLLSGSQELSGGEFLEWERRSDDMVVTWTCVSALRKIMDIVHDFTPSTPTSTAVRVAGEPLRINTPISLGLLDTQRVLFYREDLPEFSVIWEAAEQDKEFPHAELSLIMGRHASAHLRDLITATATSGVRIHSKTLALQLEEFAAGKGESS